VSTSSETEVLAKPERDERAEPDLDRAKTPEVIPAGHSYIEYLSVRI
jgi:hypothetical protein